jgi:hypothetical protein
MLRGERGGEQWQNGCKCGGMMDNGDDGKNRCECWLKPEGCGGRRVMKIVG